MSQQPYLGPIEALADDQAVVHEENHRLRGLRVWNLGLHLAWHACDVHPARHEAVWRGVLNLLQEGEELCRGLVPGELKT